MAAPFNAAKLPGVQRASVARGWEAKRGHVSHIGGAESEFDASGGPETGEKFPQNGYLLGVSVPKGAEIHFEQQPKFV